MPKAIYHSLYLFLAYLIAGKFGMLLTTIHSGYASAVWPAAGISLAGLLVYGMHAWPGVFLGSFLLNFTHSIDVWAADKIIEASLLSMCIGLGAALQGMVATHLVQGAIQLPTDFRAQRDAILFILLGCVAASFISTTIANLSLWAFGVLSSDHIMFSWLTWYVGDVMGAMIFAAPIVAWFYADTVQRRRLALSTGIPVAICFVAAFMIFWMQARWDESRIRMTFQSQASELALLLENHLKIHSSELQSLGAFFTGLNDVSAEEFAVYIKGILERHPEVQALEWAKVVPHKERAAFEEALGFSIKERGEGGEMVRAAERPYYVPVTYLEPLVGNEPTQGFDLASHPARHGVLMVARDTGVQRATEVINLVQDGETKAPAFLLIAPTYQSGHEPANREERRRLSSGYILSVLRMQDILASAWDIREHDGVAVELWDVTNPKQKALVLDNEVASEFDRRANTFIWVEKLHVGGRKWEARFRLTDHFRALHHSIQAWVTLLAGMLFTGLGATFLTIRMGYTNLVHELNEELKSDRERLDVLLQTVLSSAEEGIIVFDEDGTILSLNDAAESILGSREDGVIGLSIDGYLPGILGGDSAADGELTIEALHGGLIHIEFTISKFDWSGETQNLLIFRNVSKRKTAERQLLEKNRDLEKSNKELDEFAHIASHDLKEPLRGISHYSQFLIEDYSEQLDDEGKRKLGVLIKLTKRMEQLISSLLDYSRVGRTDMKVQVVDPKDLIDNVRDSLQISLEQSQVDLKIDEEFPRILCDKIYVEEIFRNLMSNSVKYNDKESKRIVVGWRPYSKEKDGELHDLSGALYGEGTPIFYIHDNGIGIRKKHQDGVFDLFRRLHGRDAYGGGHGAGLTIVKKIVERHGGKIWLKSEEGAFTTFYFTLSPSAPRVEPAL